MVIVDKETLFEPDIAAFLGLSLLSLLQYRAGSISFCVTRQSVTSFLKNYMGAFFSNREIVEFT